MLSCQVWKPHGSAAVRSARGLLTPGGSGVSGSSLGVTRTRGARGSGRLRRGCRVLGGLTLRREPRGCRLFAENTFVLNRSWLRACHGRPTFRSLPWSLRAPSWHLRPHVGRSERGRGCVPGGPWALLQRSRSGPWSCSRPLPGGGLVCPQRGRRAATRLRSDPRSRLVRRARSDLERPPAVPTRSVRSDHLLLLSLRTLLHKLFLSLWSGRGVRFGAFPAPGRLEGGPRLLRPTGLLCRGEVWTWPWRPGLRFC